MTTARPLADVLTRTLEVKAEQARAADPGAAATPTFDPASRRTTAPDRPGPTGVPDDGHPAEGRSRRRVQRAAAAVVLVSAMVGGIAVARDGDAGETPVDTITLGDPPAGWLVPTWVPDGMETWAVDWSSSPGWPSAREPGTVPQLFGDPDAGRAVYVTSFRFEVRPDEARTAPVRGRPGRAGPAWDETETDVGDAITWEERGATITALYRGVTRDEAVDVLDALAWRSDDPADGFAPPSDASWPLRAEVAGRWPAGHTVSLLYSRGAPTSDPADPGGGRPGLDVHTSSSSAVSADYLEAWYRQGSAAGGGVRPLTTFDEDWHELAVAWPDGRSITIRPTGVPQSDLPSRATLQRVADSLTVATEADMADVRARTGANSAALPVLASAPTGIGTVEVHGQDGFLRLCLRGAGDEAPRCTTGFGGRSSADGSAITTGAWTIDGAWYVAVATRGEVVRIVGGHDSSRSPDAGDLPAESAIVGDWTIRLVRPAPDIQMVCTTSEDGSTDCAQHRSD